MSDTTHLEFLQAAITRMAGYSFLAKGWSITLVTAVLALAVKDGPRVMALLGLLPLVMFWLVDAYYLALERGFRVLFDTAKATFIAGRAPDFDMAPTGTFAALPSALLRPAVLFVHLPLMAILLFAWCAI